MTIQIETSDTVAGLPILEVRDLLRRFAHGFHLRSLERAGYSKSRAQKLVGALTTMGYLEVGPHDQLTLTPAGKAFTRGSAAKRVKRETAGVALNEFMERVERANRNEEFLMKITAVVVFGSFLRECERLGDLDLAVELEPKNDPENLTMCHQMYMDHFEKSGRAYRHIGCEYDWAPQEVLLFLKNRKRTLSLHTMNDFVTMEKIPDFSYKVLLGDSERIAAKLRACLENASILPDHDSVCN